MTVIVTLRLQPEEHAKLREMAFDSETGVEGIGDFTRLLYHREWNRRKGLPKPKPQDWQGIFRVAGKRKIAARKKQFRFKF